MNVKKQQLSLSDRIAALTDPTPTNDFDPEEPIWDAMPKEEEVLEQDYNASSSTGFKEAPLKKRIMPDIVMGEEYRGKRINRKYFETNDPDDIGVDKDESVESEELSQLNDPRIQQDDSRFEVNLDQSSSDDDGNNKYVSDDDDRGNDSDDGIKSSTKSRQDEADQLEQLFETEDNTTTSLSDAPSLTSPDNRRTKAQHTMNQRMLWDALVDVRINFQHLVDMASQMPSPELFPRFLKEGESDSTVEKVEETKSIVKGLLEDLGGLQKRLLDVDPVVKVSDGTLGGYTEWESIDRRHKEIEQCCVPVLEKWHARTVLPSSSNRNQPIKFKTINKSILGQVESTLSGSNLENLINRSQTVPEDLHVFGEKKEKEQRDQQQQRRANPNIYNDEEFLSLLLGDRIQSGVQGLGDSLDPITMSQQYLRLRQLHRRKNKKVRPNRKASKGRKIRYQPHEKLLSFMVPLRRYPAQDTVMTEKLFNSLFGSTFKPKSNPKQQL